MFARPDHESSALRGSEGVNSAKEAIGHVVGVRLSSNSLCASVWDPVKHRCKTLKHGDGKERVWKFDRDDRRSLAERLSCVRLLCQSYLRKKLKSKKKTTAREQRENKTVDDGIVTGIVVGVRYLDHSSDLSEATIRAAATEAGFEMVHVMEEGAAASMAYGLLTVGSKLVLAFDLGAEAARFELLRIQAGNYFVEDFSSTGSCTGEVLDSCILRHVVDQLLADGIISPSMATSLYITEDRKSYRTWEQQELLDACALAKSRLVADDAPFAASVVISRRLLQAISHSCVVNSENAGRENQDTDKEPIVSVDVSISSLTLLCRDQVMALKENIRPFVSRARERSTTFAPLTIREVVLFGELTCFPFIRSIFCAALADGGLSGFDDESMDDICWSISPSEVVAHGLALRGAVLGEEDVNVLKATLMNDMVEFDIGILTFLEIDQQQPQQQQFQAVLRAGDRLPAVSKRTFPVARPVPKTVVLDIYQAAAASSITTTSVEVDGCRYELVGSYKLHLPQELQNTKSDNDSNTANMTLMLSMNQLRELTVSIDSDDSIYRRDGSDEAVSWTVWLLLGVAIVAYVFVKLYFVA